MNQKNNIPFPDWIEATAFPWAKRRPPTMKERFASLATLLGGVDGTVLDLSNNSVNFNSLLNRSGTIGDISVY